MMMFIEIWWFIIIAPNAAYPINLHHPFMFRNQRWLHPKKPRLEFSMAFTKALPKSGGYVAVVDVYLPWIGA